MMNISAVMIVKNGAQTIRRSLESLRAFDDVVVYDNGSTDETVQIARQYPNVHLIEGYFDGFGTTKNRAADFSKHDWILSIDSDEVVDEELLHALQNKELDNRTIYKVNSIAFYKDIQIRYSGWTHQKLRRLYNKTVTKFNNNFDEVVHLSNIIYGDKIINDILDQE